MRSYKNSIILYQGHYYRCAGYRLPLEGEFYVAKTGRVSCNDPKQVFDGDRLIVREVEFQDLGGRELE